ncbi:unnamed protein product [Gadus morhua 'NCC']
MLRPPKPTLSHQHQPPPPLCQRTTPPLALQDQRQLDPRTHSLSPPVTKLLPNPLHAAHPLDGAPDSPPPAPPIRLQLGPAAPAPAHIIS